MKVFHFALTLILAPVSLAFAQDSGSGGFGSGSGGQAPSGGGNYGGGASGSNNALGSIVGENYVLKPSDVLQVNIYQEEDLNKSVRIEADGTVTLPLIEKIKVGGMTVAEAQSLITDLYNRDYLVDPQISVLVVSFSPKVVRILGSVNRPGVVQMPPDRDLTLTEAIAQANGISRLGNPKSITIKRVDEQGRAQQMEVNFSRIVTDAGVKDIVLQEGDTIWVPERII